MRPKAVTLPYLPAGITRWIPRLHLLGKFSLISFVLLAAIGATVAWGIQGRMEQEALNQEAENATEQVAFLLAPNLRASDLLAPLGADRFAVIDHLVRETLLPQHIVRVKIWSPSGLLIYSDEPSLVGRRFAVEDDIRTALAGQPVVSVSDLTADENIAERNRFHQLLEIYTPLRPAGSATVAGVYEIYHDMAALQPRIDSIRAFVWGSLGLGFLVLYGSLFTLVRGASGDLRRQSAANARLYQEATQRLAERERAEAQVQRQVSRLAALRQIDIAIMAGLDLRVTLEVCLEKVVSQLQVDAATVLVLDAAQQTLLFAAGLGFRTTAPAGTQVRLGDGYAGRAARSRETLAVPRLAPADDFLRGRLLAGEGFVAYYAVPLIAKGQVKGVLEIFHRAAVAAEPEWLAFMEALAGQTAIAVDNATLFADLQRSNSDLAQAYDTTLEGWSRALDLRDKETQGHTQRVTEMTLRLARALHMSEAELVQVRRGALLHDMGKMGIPDAVLLKPGPLSDAEWTIMRRHPVYAYELLAPISFLHPALAIPYCHHEKWDGSGYPRGLRAEQIPLAARLFAVVDVWDALSSQRPYRAAWPAARVQAHIRAESGHHFDPAIVAAFLPLISEA